MTAGVEVRPATASAGRRPVAVLGGLAVAGWVLAAVLPATAGMSEMPSMAPDLLADAVRSGTLPAAAVVGGFVLGWVAMVAAMMLPMSAPMVRLFAALAGRRTGSAAAVVVFLASYLAAWAAVGLVGLAGATALRIAVEPLPENTFVAAALVLAGAFQLSPLKRSCLTACRDPRALLYARYRRGPAGAWALGVRHAASCVGCCWALMAVMFVVGASDLLWMLALTALMTAERLAPQWRRITDLSGVALLLGALAYLA